jgi:hypothetical protein
VPDLDLHVVDMYSLGGASASLEGKAAEKKESDAAHVDDTTPSSHI